ncbi:MAG: PilT/PilU family type 4a pilus ATPase [Opitutales bacterium]|nr:PilT/PilU family type 4a pilus ATPase [Opitutales bacterium]
MSHIDNFLKRALEVNASDLHLSEGEPILVRVDGSIALLENQKPDMDAIIKELFSRAPKETADLASNEFANLRDCSFSFSTDMGIRIRATLYREAKGRCAAIRIIPMQPVDAADLGLPQSVIDICALTRGMFIVTGATGSGKSTTLAAMVNTINKTRSGHIITLEDPIEYVIPSNKSLVNHREIGTHVASFQEGLRSILREDPNVVVIGELRDLESMRAAINIAETGHLVLTTLHTRNTPSTIDRLIGSFPTDDQNQIRMMLADNLLGVLAQTLIPRKTGGRIAAYELLLNNDAVKNNIREQKIYQIENILQTGSRSGMICMEDSIMSLIKDDIVDADTALAYAPSRRKLLNRLRGYSE